MSQNEFNALSKRLPVLVNARPFGKYSMVDIDAKGGLQVIIKQLLDRGFLTGDTITCTGKTLQEQVDRLEHLSPTSLAPDGDVIHSMENPYKKTGGLRLLRGNLAPEGGAVLKLAGVERGIENDIFTGNAHVFNSEQSLLEALRETPDDFQDRDMVVIRYEGPQGAPGMPEMLDATSRITALCRQKEIVIGLMTDARFSGGSVGLAIGHVGPEASRGGNIALIEDGDIIEVNLTNNTLDCRELNDPEVAAARRGQWQREVDENGGTHPHVRDAFTRIEKKMRQHGRSALQGAGMSI